MLFGKSKKDNRVVLIGLDGVPYELIVQFIEAGILKNIGEIAEKGIISKMNSSVPDVSSVAWSSFNTGCDPSHHGVFGFMDFDRDYNMYFPNFLSLKKQTLWEKLAEYNKKSIVINIPHTYPVRPFDGMIISGFISVDLKKSIHPPSLLDTMQKFKYMIDIDIPDEEDYDKKRDIIMDRIFAVLEARIKLIRHLFKRKDWDLFLGVITETDRLHHYFFDSFETETKWSSQFREVYSMIDNMVGEIYDSSNTENFFLMSDHGFTTTKKDLLINNILINEGLLKLKKPNSPITDLDPDNTKAFSLDPARIFLNDERFSKGCIKEKKDKDKVIEYLIDTLSGLKYEDRDVFMHIFRKEELYSGPLTNLSADILLVPNHGFDPKGTLRDKEVFILPKLSGMHTYDNAFFISNSKTELPENFNVQDPHWILFSRLKT